MVLRSTSTMVRRRPVFFWIFVFVCGILSKKNVVAFSSRTSGAKQPLTRLGSSNNRRLQSSSNRLAAAAKRNALDGEGVPSTFGGLWTSERINKLSEWADSKTANRPIICEYRPQSWWLWTRWKGTVLNLIWKSLLVSVLTSLGIDYWARSVSDTKWGLLSIPPQTDKLIRSLSGLQTLWSYQLTFTSFLLTFFTSQAYEYWQRIYNTTRKIQGRINDFCYLLTMSAERKVRYSTNSEDGYSPRASKLIQKCTRRIRLCHTFFWAATPTASNGLSDSEEYLADAADCPINVEECLDDDHIGPLLLSPYGLAALVESGQLTASEKELLLSSRLPPSQYHNILLEWVGITISKGLERGILRGGAGLEDNLLRQLTELRASMFDIDDFRAGRMPLAYVQLVQVLIDSLVLMAPLALYPELGSLSIPLVALLSLFFRGLLSLSKSFLDPFGVEGYTDQTINVDVLVSELNFGASRRWIQAAKILPPEDEEEEDFDEDFDKEEEQQPLAVLNLDPEEMTTNGVDASDDEMQVSGDE
jgi:hypothetical protein